MQHSGGKSAQTKSSITLEIPTSRRRIKLLASKTAMCGARPVREILSVALRDGNLSIEGAQQSNKARRKPESGALVWQGLRVEQSPAASAARARNAEHMRASTPHKATAPSRHCWQTYGPLQASLRRRIQYLTVGRQCALSCCSQLLYCTARTIVTFP